MTNTQIAKFFGARGRLSIIAATGLAVLMLAGCGTSSEPMPGRSQVPGESQATSAPIATEVAVTSAPARSATLAPPFELPNAKGDTVSLASYVGNKNVVLVFYRGFW